MATLSDISNGEIDPNSPYTTALATKYRDNPIAMHKYVRRTVNGASTASATLADDGVLEFAVDAVARVYKIQVVAYYLETSNVGTRMSLTAPAGSLFSVLHRGFDETDSQTAAAPFVYSYFTTTDDSPGIFRDAASQQELGVITDAIIITDGTAGDIKYRYAVGTVVGGNTTTIQAGSYLTYHVMDAI